MAIVAATELHPYLEVLDGGRQERDQRVELENAWVEVQAVAQEAEAFADQVPDKARRIQVAVAAGRGSIAGQHAHELELAAPLYGYRARRSSTEAQLALDDLEPTRPEPVPA